MSSLSRLQAIFSSTKNTTKSIKPKLPRSHTPKPTTSTPSLQNPTPTQIVNREIKDLLKERDPQRLVQKFTALSQHSRFRVSCREIYKLTMHRLALAKQYDLIEQALETQKEFISEPGFATRIIHLYGKYGMFDHAYKLSDELPQLNCSRNAKCLSALLGEAANSGEFDKVYELFREFPAVVMVEPSVDCYNTAMHALCMLERVDEAVLLLDEMVEKKLEPSVLTYDTLLRVYYAKGDFEGGDGMWRRMIESGVKPDVHSYNFKVQALVDDGKLMDAMELVMELESEGLKPDLGTFNALIKGFCKEDDLDAAKAWHYRLVESKLIPNKTTFAVLVPFLCEKGEYGLAFEVCQSMFKGRHGSVDEAALQNLVDGLVENSMIEEAEKLVEIGTRSYYRYNLVMPNTD